MESVAQRLDDLDRRLAAIEESLALLATRITFENGEVIVTGPLSVPIKQAVQVSRPDTPRSVITPS